MQRAVSDEVDFCLECNNSYCADHVLWDKHANQSEHGFCSGAARKERISLFPILHRQMTVFRKFTQFLSSMLMASPAVDGDGTISIKDELISAPYVSLTILAS